MRRILGGRGLPFWIGFWDVVPETWQQKGGWRYTAATIDAAASASEKSGGRQ